MEEIKNEGTEVIRIRMPIELMNVVRALAKRDVRSLQNQVEYLLKLAISIQEEKGE
jgi:hypothetical protein